MVSVEQTDRGQSEAVEHESGEDRRRSGLVRICWVFLVIIVLYVLSLGPVLKVHPGAAISSRSFKFFYKPIFALCGYFPAVSRLFDWYVHDVWRAPRPV